MARQQQKKKGCTTRTSWLFNEMTLHEVIGG